VNKNLKLPIKIKRKRVSKDIPKETLIENKLDDNYVQKDVADAKISEVIKMSQGSF
jgi:ABC-type iron transport system FetAB ATPase subunit